MKKIKLKISALFLATGVLISSCGTLVEPNYGGVLMQNYGKNGNVEGSTIRESKFNWKSSFVNSDGEFPEKLLVPGAIDSVTLFESFK
jgi:hypothetical protein